MRCYGVEIQPAILDSLSRGQPHIFEPGVAEVFEELIGKRIFVTPELPPDRVDAAIICVSTPVDPTTHMPYLKNLAARRRADRGALLAGNARGRPQHRPGGDAAATWYCRRWPMHGARCAWSWPLSGPSRGWRFASSSNCPRSWADWMSRAWSSAWRSSAGSPTRSFPSRTLETAELVKLTNNCHTDVIYAFGNEVARLTERLGLDPLEVIRATNLDYPRPDIAKPGYVGGGCLSKDPYIMMSGAERSGHMPRLIGAARALNEDLPVHVADAGRSR